MAEKTWCTVVCIFKGEKSSKCFVTKFFEKKEKKTFLQLLHKLAKVEQKRRIFT